MNRPSLRHDTVWRSRNHLLRTLLIQKGYHEITELIMGYLSASDLAALHAALDIKPSKSVRKRYLHPLRDVDPTLQIFQSWVRDDCQILMIGPDTFLLKERIQNPKGYYRHYYPRKPPRLEAWVVGIPPISKANHLRRLAWMRSLRQQWNNHRNPPAVRAEAHATLQDALDLDTLRQCSDLYDHNKPEDNMLDVNTFVGESILVKEFDLFHCSSALSDGPVGLKFLGMRFRLPWDIKRAISPGDSWTPKMACLISMPLTRSAPNTQLPITPTGDPHARLLETGMLLLFSTVTIH